jgi:citrate/tricarballylate utilization protein
MSPKGFSSEAAGGMDVAFLVSLVLVSATGMALIVLRGTELMQFTLVVHLVTVGAFFLTAPYGKFVHGVYRSAAVLRSVQERNESEA